MDQYARARESGCKTTPARPFWCVRAVSAAGVHFSMFAPGMQVDLVRQSVQVLRGFLAV
jgi:hypothetical protein